MKKVLLITLFFVSCMPNLAWSQIYLWPIQNEKAGANILYRPQDYIGDEFNFDNLFIEAPEGTTVLCPVDGVVYRLSIGYNYSLTSVMSFCDLKNLKNFNSKLEYIRKETKKSIDKKYINALIGIRYKNKTIWIRGLTGDQEFKTGQKIKKGTPIGKVGYCYHKIPKPCINIAISKNSQASDPMTPFGLKSSFIPSQEMKPIKFLTKEQVKEDFLVYTNTLKELFPGLYDILTKEELENYIAENLKYIDSYKGNISIKDFGLLMSRARARIHDSHLYQKGYVWKDKTNPITHRPGIRFGWIQDTLMCMSTYVHDKDAELPSNWMQDTVMNAFKDYKRYLKKEIASINGISADSIKAIVSSYIEGYDAKVKDFTECQLAYSAMHAFFQDDNFDMLIEFKDGETIEIKGVDKRKPNSEYSPNFHLHRQINSNHGRKYSFKAINNSTAYIGINSFSLNDVEVSQIGSFINSISNKENLIIDLRNNYGGHEDVTYKIFSYIALEPLKLNGYSKVNKIGNYENLKYAQSYTGVDTIFPEYKQIGGKDGFYDYPDSSNNSIKMDSLINFKNKVYVLTNENSISAGALFPALVVRSSRGVTVGRETRTAYHFMNALKFAHIKLPNSALITTIPLVKLVFDDVVNERVPYGRGVLPDYHVPLTFEELTYEYGDIIFNHTLKLIREGKYLKGNPFGNIKIDNKKEDEPSSSNEIKNYIIGGISIILLLIVFFTMKRKKKK